MMLGPVPCRTDTTSASETWPTLRDGTVSSWSASSSVRYSGVARGRRIAHPLFVVGDLLTPHEKLQRLRDVGHLHAEIGGAVTVDEHAELGLADDERRVDVDRTGHLFHFLEHSPVDLLQELEVGAGQQILDARGGLSSAELVDVGDRNPKIGREVGQDSVADARLEHVLRDLALVGRQELDVDARQVRRALIVVTDGEHGGHHLRHLADEACHPLPDHFRRRQAATLGKADLHLELRSIVDRQESLLGPRGEGAGREKGAEARQNDDPPPPHAPAEKTDVDALERTVGDVDDLLHAPALGARLLGLEPARGQHGGEREAHEEGDRDGKGHGDAEAPQKASGDAGDEGDGQEHRNE